MTSYTEDAKNLRLSTAVVTYQPCERRNVIHLESAAGLVSGLLCMKIELLWELYGSLVRSGCSVSWRLLTVVLSAR